MTNSSSNNDDRRVISLHGRGRAGPATPPPPSADHGPAPEEHDTDDYRHRMIVNLAALGFVVALIVAGIWLADMMAALRKAQDCVASGRRNCAPIDQPRDR